MVNVSPRGCPFGYNVYMEQSKLTKAEIVAEIKNRLGYSETEIRFILDEALSITSDGLSGGRTTELRGFGTFEPRLRKGREAARNPKTGETVSVNDHYVAAFRPGKELKERMWDMKS